MNDIHGLVVFLIVPTVEIDNCEFLCSCRWFWAGNRACVNTSPSVSQCHVSVCIHLYIHTHTHTPTHICTCIHSV